SQYPNINQGVKRYLINQDKFGIIKNSPFAYKLSEKIINYFLESILLSMHTYKEVLAHMQMINI
ncbi:hypothetical protein Q604_UNBC11060G0001, partial [human gut metagenome]